MKSVMLSFDVEEFDYPRERGEELSIDEGVRVSESGLEKIIKLLDEKKVRATFFCTGNFAKKKSDILKKLLKEGHEIACHGVDHFEPKETDIAESKKIVERMVGTKVIGYRQPRMQRIDYLKMAKSGYKYDSSVNPAFVPGRYNNSRVSKKPFIKEGIYEIPVSVATGMRIPMFWLALHLFPKKMYYSLAKKVLKKNEYFTTYFHPWEFAELSRFKVVPWYIKKNSGDKLINRLGGLIDELKGKEYEFITYKEFYERNNK